MKGSKLARKLLVDINETGMPTATEFPRHGDRPVHQRSHHLGRHRARTTESQVHREMASALSCPVVQERHRRQHPHRHRCGAPPVTATSFSPDRTAR